MKWRLSPTPIDKHLNKHPEWQDLNVTVPLTYGDWKVTVKTKRDHSEEQCQQCKMVMKKGYYFVELSCNKTILPKVKVNTKLMYCLACCYSAIDTEDEEGD